MAKQLEGAASDRAERYATALRAIVELLASNRWEDEEPVVALRIARAALADAETLERDIPSQGFYVYDSLEDRSWGPFVDQDDAEAFLASDKYLESWCVLRDDPSGALYTPDAYYGEWPRTEP